MSAVAIWACDPGNASGVAWGIFDESNGVRAAIEGRAHSGSTTIAGTELDQMRLLAEHWRKFLTRCTLDLGAHRVEMVLEDFILHPNAAPGRDSVMPVRIAWALMGFRHGRADTYEKAELGPIEPVRVIWQTASVAKSAGKDQRLKDWGVWIRGRDHERDAWRHVIARLGKRAQLASVIK